MNPFIILAIIGTVVSVIWAGVSSVVYSATGVNIPWLSFIPKFPLDFSSATIPNPSLNNTDSLPTFDWGKWIKDAPISGFVDYVTGGVASIIDWLSSAFQYLFTILINFLNPNTTLPSYFGLIVVIFLFIIFFYFSWGAIWELINRIGIIILIIVVIIIVIVVVGVMTGVIH